MSLQTSLTSESQFQYYDPTSRHVIEIKYHQNIENDQGDSRSINFIISNPLDLDYLYISSLDMKDNPYQKPLLTNFYKYLFENLHEISLTSSKKKFIYFDVKKLEVSILINQEKEEDFKIFINSTLNRKKSVKLKFQKIERSQQKQPEKAMIQQIDRQNSNLICDAQTFIKQELIIPSQTPIINNIAIDNTQNNNFTPKMEFPHSILEQLTLTRSILLKEIGRIDKIYEQVQHFILSIHHDESNRFRVNVNRENIISNQNISEKQYILSQRIIEENFQSKFAEKQSPIQIEEVEFSINQLQYLKKLNPINLREPLQYQLQLSKQSPSLLIDKNSQQYNKLISRLCEINKNLIEEMNPKQNRDIVLTTNLSKQVGLIKIQQQPKTSQNIYNTLLSSRDYESKFLENLLDQNQMKIKEINEQIQPQSNFQPDNTIHIVSEVIPHITQENQNPTIFLKQQVSIISKQNPFQLLDNSETLSLPQQKKLIPTNLILASLEEHNESHISTFSNNLSPIPNKSRKKPVKNDQKPTKNKTKRVPKSIQKPKSKQIKKQGRLAKVPLNEHDEEKKELLSPEHQAIQESKSEQQLLNKFLISNILPEVPLKPLEPMKKTTKNSREPIIEEEALELFNFCSTHKVVKLLGLIKNHKLNSQETKNLTLTSHKLIQIPPFYRLANITKLNLSYNNIVKIENLSNFPELLDLNLQKNSISLIQGLDNLEKLLKLNLSKNRILHIQNLESNINLKQLNLSFNQLTELPLAALSQLKHLQTLNIKNNKIKTKSRETQKTINELKNILGIGQLAVAID